MREIIKVFWLCLKCGYKVSDRNPGYEYCIAAHPHQLTRYERQSLEIV